MKIYYTPRSPYARKVRVTALEKGIKVEPKTEDLTNKSAELLEHNPIGKIPVLELDNGDTLCDSSLICEYLNDLKPQPPLWPRDEKQRLKLKNLDYLAKGMTDLTVSLFYEKMLHPENFNEKFIKNREALVSRSLEYFDKNVPALEELSLASIAVACAIGYILFRQKHIWDAAACPQLKKRHDEFSKRPSLTETVPTG